MASLPAIGTVPSLETGKRVSILDLLFEPCTQLHTLLVESLKENKFTSYPELIAYVDKQLQDLFDSNLESDQKWLTDILAAHPRLGEKKVDSEQSRKEQAQLNQGEPGEGKKLASLNKAYEAKFPGLRYVVFVNGRSRPVIMEDMQRRIDRGDLRQEKVDAIQAMCDIANDRAKKLLA